MVNISEDICKGAINFASLRIEEILSARGVSTPPLTPDTEETIRVGINDDEEVFFDDEDFDEGTDEEVEEQVTKVAEETMKRKPMGYANSKPITYSEFRDFMDRYNNEKSKGEKAVNRAGFHTSFNNAEMRRKAANKEDKNHEEFAYGSSSYEIFGKSKVCTEVAFNLKFECDGDDLGKNLDALCHAITFEVVKHFPKIRSIAVSDNCLIINNTCFTPNIKEDSSKFPWDTYIYIKNGCVAPFIHWRKLFRHAKDTCVTLSIDSSEFYLTYVGDSLDLGRKIGVSTAFKYLDNLDSFYLEGEVVTRDSLNTPKSSSIKKKLAVTKRSFNIFDGYNLDICKGTTGLRNFAFNSLKTYATNRGNRGFIRYALGTASRLGFATFGGVVDLGAHLTRGIFRGVKSFVSSSVTPITDDEIKS